MQSKNTKFELCPYIHLKNVFTSCPRQPSYSLRIFSCILLLKSLSITLSSPQWPLPLSVYGWNMSMQLMESGERPFLSTKRLPVPDPWTVCSPKARTRTWCTFLDFQILFYNQSLCFIERWLCFGQLQRVNIWESYSAELAVISQFYRSAKGRRGINRLGVTSWLS